MKALVWSGGAGTRLRPITHTSAKQLVPVANKPVLFYGLEAIADGGDHRGRHRSSATPPRRSRRPSATARRSASRSPTCRRSRRSGLAHAVLIARDFLGDDDFVMYLGDNFIVGGITDLVEEFRGDRPAAQILLTQVADPRAFGVAELDAARAGGRPGGEAGRTPRATSPWSGSTSSRPPSTRRSARIKPSWRGELEITHAIQWLIDSGARRPLHGIYGYWKDTGNVTDMLEVNRTVLETVEPPASTARSTRPARSSAGSRSSAGAEVVGPASSARSSSAPARWSATPTSARSPPSREDCRITDSEIEFSIVLRELLDRRGAPHRGLADRPQRRGHPGARVPSAHRLVLGDHSKVQIRS